MTTVETRNLANIAIYNGTNVRPSDICVKAKQDGGETAKNI